MKIPDQDTHLALILPSVHLKEPVCVFMGCLLGTKWLVSHREYQHRGRVEKKHPFSPPLGSWHLPVRCSPFTRSQPTVLPRCGRSAKRAAGEGCWGAGAWDPGEGVS